MTNVLFLFLQDDDSNNDANWTPEVSDNPEFIISSEDEDNDNGPADDDGDETDIYVDVDDKEQVSIFFNLK